MTELFVRIYTAITLVPVRAREEKGAAMVEYALLVVGIAVVVAAAALALGGRISDLFDTMIP